MSSADSRFMDFIYQPMKDASGQVTSIFVEGSDVTLRHATELALRESEARLRELNADLERRVIERAQAHSLTWQLSPDLLGALNAKGYFETSNPAWHTVLGWSESEVASMSIFELPFNSTSNIALRDARRVAHWVVGVWVIGI